MSRTVVATDLSSGEETDYKSIAEAVRAGYTKQCIYDCLGGRQAYHKGKQWRYKYVGFRKDKQIGEPRYVHATNSTNSGS